MLDQFDQIISLTQKQKFYTNTKDNNIYANHIVFSIVGLKSTFIVWTSSNVTTIFSSINPSSKSELELS